MDYLVKEGLILENIAAVIDKPKVYPPKTDYLNFSELERMFQAEAQNASPLNGLTAIYYFFPDDRSLSACFRSNKLKAL